jgi:hypothetical protein
MPTEKEMRELLNLGATGTHPRGKLNSDDEGGIRLAVGIDEGVVKIFFGRPVSWIGMPREHALALAESIRHQAEKLPDKEEK